jgi:hypothetical protein
MHFRYGDNEIHHQLFDLVCKVAGTSQSDVNQLKALLFFEGFVSHFFKIPMKTEQKERIRELQAKVEAEEKRRIEAGEDGMDPAASDRDIGMGDVNAMDMGSDDDADADKPEPQGSLWRKQEAEPEAAAAPAGAAADARKGKGRGKGKPKGKKGVAGKKKPGVGVPKPTLTFAPPAPEKDEDEDEDIDADEEKRGGGFSKNAKDEMPDAEEEPSKADVSQARQRAMAAANVAAAQLKSVKGMLANLERAASIQADGTAPGLKPVKLHLDSAWLREEANEEKTVSASPSAASAAAAASPAENPSRPRLLKHGRPSKLLLGSHPFYVFFRLHQFLYERLLIAKTLAHKARRNSSKKKLPVTADERHARFCVILNQLLAGDIETARFEDECRNLLGASSYVLFTVDKLIEQLLKQTVQMLSADNSLKVLSLYQYEFRRMQTALAAARKLNPAALPTEQLQVLARQYQSNIANLLGDESVCAMEYVSTRGPRKARLIEPVSMLTCCLPVFATWRLV